MNKDTINFIKKIKELEEKIIVLENKLGLKEKEYNENNLELRLKNKYLEDKIKELESKDQYYEYKFLELEKKL